MAEPAAAVCPKCGCDELERGRTYIQYECNSACNLDGSAFGQSVRCKRRTMKAQIAALTAEVERLRKALHEIADLSACKCEEAFTARRKHAHDCPYDIHAMAIEALKGTDHAG